MNKLFEKIKNSFREDFSEVTGIYYDGFKIYLAHSTHKIETDEISWELYIDAENSAIEQLAEKIFMVLNQRGWQKSKVGLCLRDDDAITLKKNFENIPPAEIESAIKTWAISQAGKNSFYTFAEKDGEIWAETLSKTVVEQYISAYKKNSINLCALTAMPNFSDESDDSTENLDKAVFIAEVISEKKSPNLLAKKIADWNVKKIFLTGTIIFILICAGISGKILYDYHSAESELDAAKKFLSAESETLVLKKTFDADVDEMKKINSLLVGQQENFPKLNALIKLGKISGDSVRLKKITATEEFLQLDGTSANPDAIGKYLSRLKNSFTANVKLENTSTLDSGEINFTVRLVFKKNFSENKSN